MLTYMFISYVYKTFHNEHFFKYKRSKMVKRGTTIRAFKITINYQKINQQFNINSDRLVKSAFWQPTLSC